MESFTWPQILLAIGASIGGVAGVIKALSFITERLDRRKAARTARVQQHITESVELRRIALDSEHVNDAAIKSALWKMLEEKKAEIDAFKATIRELEHAESLSRPIRVKIYAAMRAIRKQFDILDVLIMRQTDHAALSQEMEILRQKLDELERSVP